MIYEYKKQEVYLILQRSVSDKCIFFSPYAVAIPKYKLSMFSALSTIHHETVRSNIEIFIFRIHLRNVVNFLALLLIGCRQPLNTLGNCWVSFVTKTYSTVMRTNTKYELRGIKIILRASFTKNSVYICLDGG